MPLRRVVLGEVSVPSGLVLLIDTGLLNLWSGTQNPVLPDGVLPSEEATASANAGVDYRIEGRHAARAGRAFNRQWHPRFLYDIPSHGRDSVVSAFEQCVGEHGLDARLVAEPQRVPHRMRVTQAVAQGHGAGVVTFHGLPAVACTAPLERRARVMGEYLGAAPFETHLQRVWLEAGRGTVTRSVRVGMVAVDHARLMFVDVDALERWEHHRPLDGQADFVFWGRDAEALAAQVKAPRLSATQFGWENLALRRAITLGTRIEKRVASGEIVVATDFRPHSHHHQILARMRAAPSGAGCIEVGGAQCCAFFTGWGDGFYPVYRDFNARGSLVRLRVELATPAIVRRARQLSGLPVRARRPC